jgi:hypothetical protein
MTDQDILTQHPSPLRLITNDFSCIVVDANYRTIFSGMPPFELKYRDVLDLIVSAVNEKAAHIELAETARVFLARHDEIEPAVTARFQFAQIHGMAYKGPTYEHEIAAFRFALSKFAAQPGKEDEGE